MFLTLLIAGAATGCGDKDSADVTDSTTEGTATTDTTDVTDDTSAPTDTTPTDDSDTTDTTDTTDTGPTEAPQDCTGGSGWEPGDWISDIGEDSDEYLATAYIHVPEDLPPCAPLVFYGHGGGNAGGFIGGEWDDRLDSRWVELSDELGYIFIVPGVQADDPSSPHVWGNEAIVLDHMTDLVDAAWENADLDRSRTWFIGMSAGCHMSVWLGLYEIEPWTAIGSVSCGIGSAFDYPTTAPETRLPFYVAHDPKDIVVPYEYSVTLAEELEANGHTYTFTQWSMGPTGHSWAPGLTEAIFEWFGGL